MKKKSIIAGLLCGAFCVSVMTACANNGGNTESSQNSETKPAQTKVEQLHKLYIRAPKDLDGITATFMNTGNGNTADIEMEKSGEDDKNAVFCCEADVNLYNMVHLSYGQTVSIAKFFLSYWFSLVSASSKLNLCFSFINVIGIASLSFIYLFNLRMKPPCLISDIVSFRISLTEATPTAIRSSKQTHRGTPQPFLGIYSPHNLQSHISAVY